MPKPRNYKEEKVMGDEVTNREIAEERAREIAEERAKNVKLLERAKKLLEKHALVAMQGLLSNPYYMKQLLKSEGELDENGFYIDPEEKLTSTAVEYARMFIIQLRSKVDDLALDFVEDMEALDSAGIGELAKYMTNSEIRTTTKEELESKDEKTT